MIELSRLEVKTYRDRLIYLILVDMQGSDTTSLMLNGFKGFNNFSIDELESSVIDRYQTDNIEKLTTALIKRPF